MKLKVKRIIAREFLLFMVLLLTGILAFLGTYFWNLHFRNKVEVLNNLLKSESKHSERLLKEFSDLQKEMAKPIIGSYDKKGNPIYKYSNQLYFLTEENKAELNKIYTEMDKAGESEESMNEVGDSYKKQYGRKVGTQSISDKPILFYLLSKNDSIHYYKATSIQIELKKVFEKKLTTTSKILSHQERINLSIQILLYFGVLLFLLRYIFYGVKWSILTLKNQSK